MPRPATTYYWIAAIVSAIIAWGAFHAVGAYHLNRNPWRAVVVIAFTLGFVGWWILLLTFKHRRKP